LFICGSLYVTQTSQVFYELHAERERQGKQSEVAIVRLEQLAPFPFDLVCRELFRCELGLDCWFLICVFCVVKLGWCRGSLYMPIWDA
jgi:hypothetical protein